MAKKRKTMKHYRPDNNGKSLRERFLSVLDVIADAAYSFLPRYEAALAKADGSVQRYELSPLDTLACFMARANKGKSRCGHKHQSSGLVQVPKKGRNEQVSLSDKPDGVSATAYIAERLGISRKAAAKALKKHH